MRQWLKKFRNSKFVNDMKALGADYVEGEGKNENVVFIIPKKHGASLLGVQVSKDRTISIGTISEDCMNFNGSIGDILKEEQMWLHNLIARLMR